MAITALKAGTLISILIIFVALIYRPTNDEELLERLQTVLSGLEKVEQQFSVRPNTRVAVGYGACNDLFADAKLLFQYTSDANSPEHFDELNTKTEVLKTYAYFFRHGAAAE
jgi:ADP-dependent glucokinase